MSDWNNYAINKSRKKYVVYSSYFEITFRSMIFKSYIDIKINCVDKYYQYIVFLQELIMCFTYVFSKFISYTNILKLQSKAILNSAFIDTRHIQIKPEFTSGLFCEKLLSYMKYEVSEYL